MRGRRRYLFLEKPLAANQASVVRYLDLLGLTSYFPLGHVVDFFTDRVAPLLAFVFVRLIPCFVERFWIYLVGVFATNQTPLDNIVHCQRCSLDDPHLIHLSN